MICKVVVTLREKYDMDKMVAKHLMHNYGTRALIVADLAKDYAKVRVFLLEGLLMVVSPPGTQQGREGPNPALP